MSKAETYSSSFYGCKCKQPQWAGNGKFATPCWNNANWSLYPGILAGRIDKQACRAVGNYYWQGNLPKKVRKNDLDYSIKHIIRGAPSVDSTITTPSPRQESATAVAATEMEMNLCNRIVGVNFCIARSAGLPFDNLAKIAGGTLAQLIPLQHAGMITQVGSKPLSSDALLKGSINSAVLVAAEICPKEVPADVMAKVRNALKQPATTPASSNN
jgi:hypothetical protein